METFQIGKHFFGMHVPDEDIYEFALTFHGHLACCTNITWRVQIEANNIFFMFIEESLFVFRDI